MITDASHRIRQYDIATTQVTSIAGERLRAGDQDGGIPPATAGLARFDTPLGMAIHPQGQGQLIVADQENGRLRSVDFLKKQVTTIAGDIFRGFRDGRGFSARFEEPRVFRKAGGSGLVGQAYCIRQLNLQTYEVTKLTRSCRGGGPVENDVLISDLRLLYVTGMAWDSANQQLYVSDGLNQCIARLDLSQGKATSGKAFIVTGALGKTTCTSGARGFKNGTAAEARFSRPGGLLWVPSGTSGTLYIADSSNHCIRSYSPSTGQVATVAGTCDPRRSGSAGMNFPTQLAWDGGNQLFVSDANNSCIRIFTMGQAPFAAAGVIGRCGTKGHHNSVAATALFRRPTHLVWEPGQEALYITDAASHCIRKWSKKSGLVTDVAGRCSEVPQPSQDGPAAQAGFRGPAGLLMESQGRLLIADKENQSIRLLLE